MNKKENVERQGRSNGIFYIQATTFSWLVDFISFVCGNSSEFANSRAKWIMIIAMMMMDIDVLISYSENDAEKHAISEVIQFGTCAECNNVNVM